MRIRFSATSVFLAAAGLAAAPLRRPIRSVAAATDRESDPGRLRPRRRQRHRTAAAQRPAWRNPLGGGGGPIRLVVRPPSSTPQRVTGVSCLDHADFTIRPVAFADLSPEATLRPRRTLGLTVFGFLGIAPSSRAQPQMAPGASVRVWIAAQPTAPLVGVFAARGKDSLDIAGKDGIIRRIALHDVQRVQVAIKGTSHRGRGAFIGAGVGFLVGAGTASAMRKETSDDRGEGVVCTIYGWCNSALMGLSGGLLGAGIGALVGGPHDKWLDVAVEGLSLAPTGGAILIGVRVPIGRLR